MSEMLYTHFEKVGFDEFREAYEKCFPKRKRTEAQLHRYWEEIKLPKRATSGSAGYDFFTPVSFSVWNRYDDPVTVPTGIKIVGMPSNVFFMMMPKSGIGFRTGIRLSNTVGVIDSDYEGQIMVRFEPGSSDLDAERGDKFIQGVFMPFLVTTDDEPGDHERGTGGFGSTGK